MSLRLHSQLSLLIIATLLAAACGPAPVAGPSPAEACEIGFGANASITGPAQVYAAPAAEGIKTAVKHVNDAGGVKVGNRTCKMTAVLADNRSDPAQVFTAAQQVVDGKAIAAFPDNQAPVVYEAWKKAGIITWAATPDLGKALEEDPAANPLLVGLVPNQGRQKVTYMRQALAAQPDIKTIAIISPSDSQGDGFVKDWTNAAKQTGVQLVSTVRYPVGTGDFSTFLTQVKSARPDVLVAFRSVQEVQGIIRQGAQLGVAKYYMSETMGVDTALNTPGVENAVILLPTFAPTYSRSATLPEDKPEVIFGTGDPPLVPGAAIVTYYAVWLTKQAIEKAGSTDVNKVFEALKGQSYDGPFGRCSMSQQLFMECTTIFSVVKGKTITVQRFLTPQDTKPQVVYDCTGGKCTKK